MAQQMYGLFKKVDGKWLRKANSGAYAKQQAVRIFQNDLMAFEGWQLRVVKAAKVSQVPASHVLCKPCEAHLHSGCEHGSCACGCRMFNG